MCVDSVVKASNHTKSTLVTKMDIREAIVELAKEDANLARHIKWRQYAYRLEVQARLREQYDMNVSVHEISQAVRRIDSDLLTELGEFDIHKMTNVISDEFRR